MRYVKHRGMRIYGEYTDEWKSSENIMGCHGFQQRIFDYVYS